MTEKMRIGFFDSGVGGISVLREALKLMPREDYLYYADTMHVPYGTRTKDEVKKLVFDAVEFIAAQDVKAVVIACNTATSVAICDLRTGFDIPVIGMEPAVKPALDNKSRRTLVTATELTLREEKLHNLITRLNGGNTTDLLALPGLVSFAEKTVFDRETVSLYLQEKLSGYDLDEYDAFVLGCTHFIFFKDILRELLPPHILLYDGNTGTVKNLYRILSERGNLNGGTGDIVYCHSSKMLGDGDEKELEKYRRLFLRLDSMEQNGTSMNHHKNSEGKNGR